MKLFCVLAALGVCSPLFADVIRTYDATSATVTLSQSGYRYSISGANFTFSGSVGTGPNDFYPANTPIPLSQILPGTNINFPQPLAVTGTLTVDGATFGAYYFGQGNLLSLGVATFSAPDIAASYNFPAIVQGSFVACTVPGYQLCDTSVFQPDPPIAANITVRVSGTETLTVVPTAFPNLITYQLSFASTPAAVPEPASIGLFLVAGAAAIFYRLHQSA